MNTRNLARYFRVSASARVLATLVFILTSSIIAFGQQITGSIVGTVKDQQGALITTATVKAINVDTGYSRSAPVNGSGEYRIDLLPVGRYTVEAVAKGFERFVQQNLALNVDQTLTVDIPLTVGAQSLTITVTEAPPQINMSDAVLGRTIEPEEIIGLPLVNRNAYAELSLVPGVMANNNSPTSNPSGAPTMTVGINSEAIQVNGSLDSGNGTVGFYLDGGNNITGMRNYGNPAPNPDAVEEFRVETSAFAAQYGQFSAAVVSVITKSGTNKFHGSLFEFNRNTDFNAWGWGQIPATNSGGFSTKAPYHRNQFGGTVGGPVKHDKAFFFFSYAGLRQVQGSVISGAVVPTAAERVGDFTADTTLTTLIYTPNTSHTAANLVNGVNAGPGCSAALISAATAGYCIPTALLDTTAANFLNVSNTIGVSIPLPNGAVVTKTGGEKYTTVYVTPTKETEYLGKFDMNLGDKDHVGVTYFNSKTLSTPDGGTNVNWTGNVDTSPQTNAIISDVHSFSPSMANQTWLTFTRAIASRVMVPVTGPANQTLTSFGSNFVMDGQPGLPQLTGAGFNTGNPNAGPVTGSDNYELRDMVTITKGKHNLSLGGEYSLDKTMFSANLNNYGELTFGLTTTTAASSGVLLADFDMGQFSGFEQDAPYTTHISTWHYAAFAQDNYRITPRFTANLGLRWDIDTPPVDAHDRTGSFVPGHASTVFKSIGTSVVPVGDVTVGDKGISRGIIGTSFAHISPRLGFAWDPFGDGKTAIRAAAGIFYGNPAGNEWNQPGNAQPFSVRNNFGNGTSLTHIYNVGFPSTAAGGGIFPYTYSPASPKFFGSQSIEAISPNFKDSSVYQFNLSVQRQLPYKISATAAYVGTLGRHLNTFIDANYAPYATVNSTGGALVGTLGSSAASYEQRRQFDGGINLTPGTLNGITYLISDQTSNYNGLQVSATKTISHGFSVSGFYVWSRALESGEFVENGGMTAQDFGYFGKPFTAANNSMGAVGGGLGEEYGLMNNNRDSNSAISGMWKIDYYHGSNKIVKEVVNGWTISSVAFLQSGLPFSMSAANHNDDSQSSNRPNAVPGVSPKLDPHRCRVCATGGVMSAWYNTAAFTNNGPGLPGGIGPGGADGNVGRNSLQGPGLKDMDAGLLRDVKLYRSTVFQFRAEITNVMNWVNLGQPNGSLTAGGAEGTITGTVGTQRVIQLGGRLTF
jgi:hypothetical protein